MPRVERCPAVIEALCVGCGSDTFSDGTGAGGGAGRGGPFDTGGVSV